MGDLRNPIQLTKEILPDVNLGLALTEKEEQAVKREAEESTEKLNWLLSKILLNRIPLLERMLTFLTSLEKKVYNDDYLELAKMRFFDENGKEIAVFDANGHKIQDMYNIALLRELYEKVNKDFLGILEFIRKYINKLPAETPAGLTDKEKGLSKSLTDMSRSDLEELVRTLDERKATS